MHHAGLEYNFLEHDLGTSVLFAVYGFSATSATQPQCLEQEGILSKYEASQDCHPWDISGSGNGTNIAKHPPTLPIYPCAVLPVCMTEEEEIHSTVCVH